MHRGGRARPDRGEASGQGTSAAPRGSRAKTGHSLFTAAGRCPRAARIETARSSGRRDFGEGGQGLVELAGTHRTSDRRAAEQPRSVIGFGRCGRRTAIGDFPVRGRAEALLGGALARSPRPKLRGSSGEDLGELAPGVDGSADPAGEGREVCTRPGHHDNVDPPRSAAEDCGFPVIHKCTMKA